MKNGARAVYEMQSIYNIFKLERDARRYYDPNPIRYWATPGASFLLSNSNFYSAMHQLFNRITQPIRTHFHH